MSYTCPPVHLPYVRDIIIQLRRTFLNELGKKRVGFEKSISNRNKSDIMSLFISILEKKGMKKCSFL